MDDKTEEIKIPIDQLISSKDIQNAFQVGRRTVRRWANLHKWRELRYSHKVLMYLKKEVEDSLAVSFTRPTPHPTLLRHDKFPWEPGFSAED